MFASKAFPCTAVQRVMAEEGLGLDVAGGGEIVTALKAGVDPALLVLHGNAKTDEEIAMAVEHGLGLVVVDNADDVDRLEATVPAGRAQDVLVRVIPGVTADTHAHVLTGHEGSKFGLAPAAAAELIRRIERSPRLRMQGLHVHVGLADPRRRAVRAVGRAGRRARRVPGLRPRRRAGRALHLRRRAADASATTSTRSSAPPASTCPPDAELIIEPGRSMVAPAPRRRSTGSSPSSAARARSSRSTAAWATTSRSRCTASASRPAIAGRVGGDRRRAGHAWSAATARAATSWSTASHLPARGSATCWPCRRPGAYCFTMANNYNGARRIPVVFARDGAARLVVRRETLADLLARDVG